MIIIIFCCKDGQYVLLNDKAFSPINGWLLYSIQTSATYTRKTWSKEYVRIVDERKFSALQLVSRYMDTLWKD